MPLDAPIQTLRRARLALGGVIALGAAILLALVWASRGWPLFHDAPLMFYVAWLIDQGAVPYRDIFDMNFPGTYLLHLGVLRGFGGGDAGWRIFELLWLGGTLGALYRLVSPLSRRGALLGATLYGGYHLSSGPTLAGQRDFLLMLPLFIGADLVARWGASLGDPPASARRTLGLLIGAGLALGAALTIKPTPVLYWGGLGVLALVWGRHLGLRRAMSAPIVLLSTGLVPMALCLTWVWALGGLGAFFTLMGDYVFPLYAKLGRVGIMGDLSPRHFAFLGAMALVALLGAMSWEGRRPLRLWVILLGVAYGALHYVLQGKSWGYHLTPFAAFAAAGFGAAAWPIVEARPRLLGALAYLGVALLLFGGEAGKGLRGLGPDVKARIAQVHAVEADVAACAAGGRPVQVLETAQGGIHALFTQGVRQPTRFIYDFPFFHDLDAPVIQGYRAELIQGLEATPPGCILFMEEGWPDGGYERLEGFPALAALLNRDYALGAEGRGYRRYEHR